MLGMSDLRLGTVINYNGEPYQITWTQHIKMARSGATLRTKMKNLISGAVLEKTFAGGDKVEEADLAHSSANFLYQQQSDYFFMDNQTFEQYQFSAQTLDASAAYLMPGQTVDVMLFNGRAVAVALPKKIALTVTQAPPGIKGDTSGSATKSATLETGLEIKVPLFIKEGEKVIVNTETGDYVERA